MELTKHFPTIGVIAFLVLGVAAIVYRISSPAVNSAVVNVKVPELSQQALAGKGLFDKNCAACHGDNGSGSNQGPPLVYDIYNPGHHSDASFLMAAQKGVRQHHWQFGNMPPRPEVSKEDVALIISYIRELQTANGIFYKQHRM